MLHSQFFAKYFARGDPHIFKRALSVFLSLSLSLSLPLSLCAMSSGVFAQHQQTPRESKKGLPAWFVNENPKKIGKAKQKHGKSAAVVGFDERKRK
jgi:hypothetical protein